MRRLIFVVLLSACAPPPPAAPDAPAAPPAAPGTPATPPAPPGGAPGTPPAATGDPAEVATKFPGSKLYLPTGASGPTAAVVLLHGSEGGTDGAIWPTAEMLAKDAGVVTLALCWFGCPGTPAAIQHVPLERVREAARWLKTLPVVAGAKVGLFGWSRGAEQSALLASLLAGTSDFAAVALHATSDTVVCAYDPARQDVLTETHPTTGQTVFAAAWTWGGQPLFGELAEPYGSGPRIAAEKYPGPMWVSHGVEDELWEVERSYRLVDARQKAGLPTETHYWTGEGHILMRPQNRSAFDASLVTFMTASLR